MQNSKLQIKRKNYDEMKAKYDELMELKKRGVSDVKEIEPYFREVKVILDRMAIGRTKMDSVQPTTEETIKSANLLYSLYVFMYNMIGEYDKVFKALLMKINQEQEYLKLRNYIMNHLNN